MLHSLRETGWFLRRLTEHCSPGLVIAAVMLFTASPAGATRYKAFLLAGQSNMTGNGLNSELPPSLAAPQTNVRMFYGHQAVDGWDWGEGVWDYLRPGCSKDPARFGCEITFGRDVAAAMPGDHIALVKYAKASVLAGDWLVGDTLTGVQYGYFRTTISNALAQLPAGDTLEWAGMLWMQGEGDAGNATTAAAYEQNLIRFINGVRADLNAPDLPFIIGQIADNWRYASIVQQAQANVVQVDQVPHTGLVVTRDLSRWANDPPHFDTDGILALGERFADEYVRVANVPEPSTVLLLGIGVAGMLGRTCRRRKPQG